MASVSFVHTTGQNADHNKMHASTQQPGSHLCGTGALCSCCSCSGFPKQDTDHKMFQTLQCFQAGDGVRTAKALSDCLMLDSVGGLSISFHKLSTIASVSAWLCSAAFKEQGRPTT